MKQTNEIIKKTEQKNKKLNFSLLSSAENPGNVALAK
jgi:hypothetical protein